MGDGAVARHYLGDVVVAQIRSGDAQRRPICAHRFVAPICGVRAQSGVAREEEAGGRRRAAGWGGGDWGGVGKDDAILNEPVLDLEHQNSSSEEEKIQEEESDASTSSEGQDPSLKMYEKEKVRIAEGKKIQEEEPGTSATSTDRDPSLTMHEDKNCNPEEEQIQEEECETSSVPSDEDPSPTVRARAKRGFKNSDQIDGDSGTVSLQRKLVKQSGKSKLATPSVNHLRRSSRRLSSALGSAEMLNDKVVASRSLRQPRQPLVKLANYTFSSGKRKRLLWTEEEEETLKAGVQKYSTDGNKNLPWTKILDFGQHKFDRTRTPSDLKDKWRNMMAK
ncbi:hypothetical protein Sango_1297700 [Sesamum angolense]|uniref:Myb-like domain-containing protein n=1 Tax=Sesamum angolense TaxID=2727404 RepID=A0AAE2BUG0_9LAMI|nr:hypothetical protein Sango_1297700 [Sesamum angolense]